LTRSYESNGPDVKIRGTAQHIAEKYSQLARDAHSSGDPVAAENYYQHAEHYIRIIAAAQEVLREQYGYQPRSFEDEGDEEAFEQRQANGDDGDPSSQPQPFEARQDGDRRPRYDRQDRGGQDRGSQDRGDRQDRNDRQDRDRQNAGDRQDRGDRQSTGDRQDRPDRDRQDRDRQDRGERRDRFPRDRAPRPEFQREEQPRMDFDRGERIERNDRTETPTRAERPERPEAPPARAERVERAPRGRPPRREPPREETDQPAGLPAFLTNPVRTVLDSDIDEAPVAAPRVIESSEAEIRPRRRAVRRPPSDEADAGPEANDSIGNRKAETPAE
jgi:hypothetical protein